MPDVFDPSIYLRLPRLDVHGTLDLGQRLLRSVPKRAPAGLKRRAVALRQAVGALDRAVRGGGEGAPAIDLRPFERRLVRLWTAIRDRLLPYEALSDHAEKKTQAAELQAALFGAGLEFLQLPFASQYAESDKRLATLDETDNASVLEALVDPAFVEELRAAHEAYGKALGEPPPSGPGEQHLRLLGPLRDVSQAIAAYTVQVLAFAIDEGGHEALAYRALEPLDRVRRDTTAREREAFYDEASWTEDRPPLLSDASASPRRGRFHRSVLGPGLGLRVQAVASS